jgi:hypothetical protein
MEEQPRPILVRAVRKALAYADPRSRGKLRKWHDSLAAASPPDLPLFTLVLKVA